MGRNNDTSAIWGSATLGLVLGSLVGIVSGQIIESLILGASLGWIFGVAAACVVARLESMKR